MGVNSEKEPLSGTTPERRLLDKSLHFKVNIENKTLALHKNIVKINKPHGKLAHSTCRAVTLVSDMGMGPVRLLLLSRLSLDKHTMKMVLELIFYSGSKNKQAQGTILSFYSSSL